MERLKEIYSRCKGSVSVEINEHRDQYMTVGEYLDQPSINDYGIPKEVREKMIESDTIIAVHFYPATPVGFFRVWNYDLDAVLDAALECLNA